MNTSATSLQAKILAINTSNKNSETILNYELLNLSKYIGQDILKADGGFKSKINHVKHNGIKSKFNAFGFTWYQDTNYYFSTNYNKLTLNIRTCVMGGGSDSNGVNKHCIYETQTIDIFIIDTNGNLQSLEKQYFKNVQYNEAKVLKAAAKVKVAAEIYNKTLDSMPYEFRGVTNCERLTR